MLQQQIGRVGVGIMAAAFAGAGLAAGAPAAHAGAVTILSQDRTVRATADVMERDDVSDVRTSGDAGAFDATASADDAGEGFMSRASASVTSLVSPTKMAFSGVLSYATLEARPFVDDTEDFGSARVGFDFQVQFSVDTPHHYSFQGGFNTTDSDPNSTAEGDFRLSGAAADGEFFNATAGEVGVLEPGLYTLWLQESAGDGISGPMGASFETGYAFSLDLAPVDEPPHAIPLPPAAWSALTVFGAAALRQLRKRRAA